MALSMLNAYYSFGCDSKELFKDLKISKDSSFETHLNKHNAIWIDMASVYSNISDKTKLLQKLRDSLYLDFNEMYPNVLTDYEETIADALRKIHSKTNERK